MLESKVDVPVRDEASPPPRRRRRRLWALLGGTAALAIGAAGAALALGGGSDTPARSASGLPTVAVVRTTMVRTSDVDGTLGFADTYTVLAGGKGRVTWLPRTGDVIERGERVYGLDGEKVPLVYGDTPFWRTFQQGMTKGKDVLELERNLDKLGYGDDMTVDRSFTWATAEALRDWQDDLGLPETGELDPDAVVVQPGAIRVTKLSVVLGAPAGGSVLTASSIRRVVTVNLPVSRQEVAVRGAKVRVTLPGGKTTTGRITTIGTTATAGTTNAQSQTGQGTENATIPVTITLDKAGGAADFDGAPATVGFTSTEHKNVLAVPINALMASAEGAYSVTVVDASGTVHSVPVKLGIYDGDRVEVSGDLQPGMKVQVPKS
ncbi:peptidoglycan-binding protein [Actinomadura meridiana]|uniref:Peptidoglycan-binding protein n=1 Tax=Actinomadura meridiana TaxID=559626 RepID=A0ABP8BZT4_9ACTN